MGLFYNVVKGNKDLGLDQINTFKRTLKLAGYDNVCISAAVRCRKCGSTDILFFRVGDLIHYYDYEKVRKFSEK